MDATHHTTRFYITGNAELDTDGDGLVDVREWLLYRTNELLADTDGDGLIDGWEVLYDFSPLSLNNTDGALGDVDNDGIGNLEEQMLGTDPKQSDVNANTGSVTTIRYYYDEDLTSMDEANKEELKKGKRQLRQDEIDRIPVEGKFGQAKRRFGLGVIKTKLAETTKSAIHLTFIVMNLEKWLNAIYSRPFFSLEAFLYGLKNLLWRLEKILRGHSLRMIPNFRIENHPARFIQEALNRCKVTGAG